MSLIALPTSADDAIDLVIKKLSGETVETLELCHAGIHVEAYLLGKIHQHPTTAGNAPACPATTAQGQQQWLKEQLLKCKGTGLHADAGAIPWKPILGMVLQLVLQWLQTQ